MANVVYFALIAGLSGVVVACAVAYVIVQGKIDARKALDRREYLKARARAF